MRNVAQRLTCVALLTLSTVAACTSSDKRAASIAGVTAGTTAAPWKVSPGVEVLTVVGAKAAEPLTLYNSRGRELMTVKADKYGQAAFPYVPAKPITVTAGPKFQIQTTEGGPLVAGTYVLRNDESDPPVASKPFRVLAVSDTPPQSLYDSQKLKGSILSIVNEPVQGHDPYEGFQYITVRDGVKLSAMVRFPDETFYGKGPWPTVIEYSGYGVSNPDSEEPGARIARALGYATVSVNMRGTGCSGGVFDVFNPAQQADGYDIVETVAAQDWVLGGKPGMVGLSYSGIGQLYTAATAPPHLAAITPQSVIVDPWLQQWPGGIYNAGFTRAWLAERDRQAAPGGQDWTKARIDSGDATCEGHQQLRNLNLDFEYFGKSLEMRPPAAEERDLRLLARRITAPTFLTGAFHDEQTGPQFASMVDHFDQASVFRAAMWNGRHPDGYTPINLNRWYEFLEFYVARRVPKMAPAVRTVLTTELAKNFNFEDIPLEADRFASTYGDDYDAALQAYEKEDPVRVVFESGAGGDEVGEPTGTFERSYSTWPPREAKVVTWHLADDGALSSSASDAKAEDTFRFDPEAGETNFIGENGGLFDPTWGFDWTRFASDKAAVYTTPPFSEETLLGGPMEAELWMAADATDANIQVTVSELRPDGVEYLLQSGWLRLGHRKVDKSTSEGLRVEHTFTAADYQPLTPGEFVQARIAIPSVGAPIRKGSRLRLTVSTPGRDRAEWTFENPTFGPASPTYRVGRGGAHDSTLKISVVPAGEIPAATPPCPSLRGQACRAIPAGSI